MYSKFVCSISYPACKAHAPYCCLGILGLHCTFPHYFIISRIQREMIKNVCWLHVEYPLFLSDFEET